MNDTWNKLLLLAASWSVVSITQKLHKGKRRNDLPKILHRSGTQSIVDRCKNVLMEYDSSVLLTVLDFYGELQMLWTVQMRKFFPIHNKYDRELLVLADGGTVAIDWLVDDSGSKYSVGRDDVSKPIVILQHGLCGHTYSHYMRGIPKNLQAAGFYVVSFVARGCGGIELTTPETFTAARTSDFRAVVAHINARYPDRSVCAIGYSLGAGLLLKYLGEEGESCPLTSAVAISPSFDFHIRTDRFDYYEKLGMLQGLLDLVQKHSGFLEHHPTSCLDWNGMVNAKTIRDFDQAAIVGRPPNKSSRRFGNETSGSPDKMTGRGQERDFLHYASVDDYYTASSSKHYTHLIHTPTLTINADDDQISSIMGVPTTLDQLGMGLAVLKVPHGSHVSFSDAPWKYGPSSSWSDRAATAWLSAAQ